MSENYKNVFCNLDLKHNQIINAIIPDEQTFNVYNNVSDLPVIAKEGDIALVGKNSYEFLNLEWVKRQLPDTILSDVSTNSVQNKVVNSALNNKPTRYQVNSIAERDALNPKEFDFCKVNISPYKKLSECVNGEILESISIDTSIVPNLSNSVIKYFKLTSDLLNIDGIVNIFTTSNNIIKGYSSDSNDTVYNNGWNAQGISSVTKNIENLSSILQTFVIDTSLTVPDWILYKTKNSVAKQYFYQYINGAWKDLSQTGSTTGNYVSYDPQTLSTDQQAQVLTNLALQSLSTDDINTIIK